MLFGITNMPLCHIFTAAGTPIIPKKTFNSRGVVGSKKYVFNAFWKIKIFLLKHCMKSVRIRNFLVSIFPHSEWIRRYMEHLSVFNSYAGKYVAEKLRIWTLFTQWKPQVMVFCPLRWSILAVSYEYCQTLYCGSNQTVCWKLRNEF